MDHTGWWVDLSKWFWYPKVTEKQHLPVGGFAVPFLERIGAVQRSDRIWSLVEKRWIQWCFVIDSTDVFISHFVPLTLAQKERKIGYVEFFKEMNKFTNEIWNYLEHKKQKKQRFSSDGTECYGQKKPWSLWRLFLSSAHEF